MTSQYLLASFIAILWMPITQPQLTSRLAAASKISDIPVIALGISFFAFVILLPTIVIGFAGAALHPTSTSGEFLADTLVFSQAGWIGALSIVGLIAAAMSTADSQFFALRTETQQVVKRDPDLRRKVSGLLFVVFFAAALVLAFVWQEEIVPLARVSFAGTALLGPMIVAALLHKEGRMGYAIPIATAVALMAFLLSQFGWIVPSNIGFVRLDLALMFATAIFALIASRLERTRTV